MNKLQWVLPWLAGNAQNLLAIAALASIGVGLWMAWPPLGLIVPGGIVFGALAWTRIKGE